jgi:hypothetical protein
VHTFRRTGKGGLRLPSTGIRYGPEHIPAFLPLALADRHLQLLADLTPKMRRRSASVFLVRRARGGSLNEAAQFLGISAPDKAIGFTQKLNQYLRAHGKVHDFELALDAITAELQPAPSSTTGAAAKPWPPGRSNQRPGSAWSPNCRSIGHPETTTANAWP